MNNFVDIVRQAAEGTLDGVSDTIIIAMSVTVIFLVIASIVALIISIYLGISYRRYNRKDNHLSKTGEQIARMILDRNGLQNIKVTKNGSILFGNSYSHYFKKIRLRKRTWKKTSVTSLAMAAQKSSLAILDKEGDRDMRTYVRLTPFIYLGPLAFVPMVIIGVLLDMVIFNSSGGICTIVFLIVGVIFYLISFLMSILVIKTEKKAQKKAVALMKEEGFATDDEIKMTLKLYKLYNIEYVNNMIIALLELIYRVLQIVAYIQSDSVSK